MLRFPRIAASRDVDARLYLIPHLDGSEFTRSGTGQRTQELWVLEKIVRRRFFQMDPCRSVVGGESLGALDEIDAPATMLHAEAIQLRDHCREQLAVAEVIDAADSHGGDRRIVDD